MQNTATVYYYFLICHGRTADDVTITWMKKTKFLWNYKIIHSIEETEFGTQKKTLFGDYPVLA
jgi:hypothetical protein